MDKLQDIQQTDIEDLSSLNFWVVSDSHFYHSNIIKYSNRPYHHDRLMIDHWWEKVKPDDVILHLGDVAMPGGILQVQREHLIKNLPGTKYLILGNHDVPKGITDRKTFYEKLGFAEVVDEFYVPHTDPKTGKDWKVYFTHRPGGEIKPFDDLRIVKAAPNNIGIHGHVHSNTRNEKEEIVEINKRLINLSVEVTNYSPVWLPDILAERLADLQYKRPAKVMH